MEEERKPVDVEAIKAQAVREHQRKISSAGGQAVKKKFGREYMSELGKRGAAKRWPKQQNVK